MISTSIIRRDTDYAIRAMLHLAGAESFVSGPVLARRCELPLSFTHKIMKRLVHAGLASSRAGRAGGFTLARKPAKIAMAEIVEAVQGSVNVRPCLVEPSLCPNSKLCRVSRQWLELQAGINRFFEQTTLDDVWSHYSAEAGGSRSQACSRRSVNHLRQKDSRSAIRSRALHWTKTPD